MDEELKTIAQEFSNMLKPIIQSVDRFGLRKRHLQKHKKSVNRFLSSLWSRDFISPVAKGYKQRFEKIGAKMFTFLDYDGVPWNNNYAEHAIKRFAKYRRLFDGLYTEESLNEYLILASILTTCEFNNINGLKFLLSEEKSLERFLTMGQTKSRRPMATHVRIEEISEPQDPCFTSAEVIPSNQLTVRVNCTDSNWKQRCKILLKARQEFVVSDFNADADRDWANFLARRYGAKCQVRKGMGSATFTFSGAGFSR